MAVSKYCFNYLTTEPKKNKSNMVFASCLPCDVDDGSALHK